MPPSRTSTSPFRSASPFISMLSIAMFIVSDCYPERRVISASGVQEGGRVVRVPGTNTGGSRCSMSEWGEQPPLTVSTRFHRAVGKSVRAGLGVWGVVSRVLTTDPGCWEGSHATSSKRCACDEGQSDSVTRNASLPPSSGTNKSVHMGRSRVSVGSDIQMIPWFCRYG